MSFRIGALATPLKSPCDQRERGRKRAYEQSECASGGSKANGKRHRGASRGALGTYYRMRFLYCLLYSGPQVERERAWRIAVRAECLRIIKSPTIDKNSRYLVIKIS